jgi:hypothetical protein
MLTHLKHHLDTTMADFSGSIENLLLGPIGTTESGLNESFTVLLEKLPDCDIRNRGDLD